MDFNLAIFISDNFEYSTIGLISLFLSNKVRKYKKIESKAIHKFEEAVKKNMHEPMTLHPEVDVAKCLGCGSCTKVCPV